METNKKILGKINTQRCSVTLNELSITFGKDRVGLYRDDGLILLKGTRGRLADQTRKKLHHLFEQFDLKITAEVSHQTVNFLDITLNLADGSYKPYRKPNNEPLYINSHSNHPPPLSDNYLCQLINESPDSLPTNKHSTHRRLYTNKPSTTATTKASYTI
jgi:hypothetical protein